MEILNGDESGIGDNPPYSPQAPERKITRTAAASIKSFQVPRKEAMFILITDDNGSEFSNHGGINGSAYVCDARGLSGGI